MVQKAATPTTCANCGARVVPGVSRCEYCRQPVVWETIPAVRGRGGTRRVVMPLALGVLGVAVVVLLFVGHTLSSALKESSRLFEPG